MFKLFFFFFLTCQKKVGGGGEQQWQNSHKITVMKLTQNAAKMLTPVSLSLQRKGGAWRRWLVTPSGAGTVMLCVKSWESIIWGWLRRSSKERPRAARRIVGFLAASSWTNPRSREKLYVGVSTNRLGFPSGWAERAGNPDCTWPAALVSLSPMLFLKSREKAF